MKTLLLAATVAALSAAGCSGTESPTVAAPPVSTEQIIDVGGAPPTTSAPLPAATSADPPRPGPTTTDLLNASLPPDVLGDCLLDGRLQLDNGEASGVASLEGRPWAFGLGVARRNGDGQPLIAVRDPAAPGPPALMVVTSGCEASGRNMVSHLLLCDATTCEVAVRLEIDEVPFVSTGIVTYRATDLAVNGDELVVTMTICSGTTGCADEFQRYRWSGPTVERIG